jgi:hypothetical protein
VELKDNEQRNLRTTLLEIEEKIEIAFQIQDNSGQLTLSSEWRDGQVYKTVNHFG